MPPVRVADVLAEVFQTYGFDTCQASEPEGMTGATYRVDLQAEKGGMDVLVTVRCQDGPLDADVVDQQAAMVRDVGAYYGVVACPAGFTEAAHRHAARTRTILWDRNALEAVIGRAVIHEILDGTRRDPAVAEVLGVVGHAPFAATQAVEAAHHETGEPPVAHPAPQATETAETAPETVGLPGMALFDSDEETSAAPNTPGSVAAGDDLDDGFDPLSMLADPDDAAEASSVSAPMDPPTYEDQAPEPTAEPSDDGRSVLEGNGWVLETTRRVISQAEAPPTAPRTEDRPSAPSHPTGLASLAALGGTRRHTKHSGPDPRSFNPSSGALLAPAVDKARAAGAAKQKIFTIDHTWLRYHPKRVLRWKVEAFVEGQVDTTTIEGVRLIDLATRAVEDPKEWTASRHLREGTFDVPVEHKPVRIDAEKAHGLVMDSILEATAREVTMEDYDTALDIIITQKKRIRAHRDDVVIQDEGLHWCPVWCFQGVNGTVEVDGLTGTIIDERLEQSDSETIVL